MDSSEGEVKSSHENIEIEISPIHSINIETGGSKNQRHIPSSSPDMSAPSSPLSPRPMTPLPTDQIITVVCVQVCEAMNINVLFPFLAFMVEDFGYTGAHLGYAAGLLAASFCGAQFLSSTVWGMLSDKYGRKPCILLGTLGAALGMLVFGTAKSYPQAVVGRCLSGLLSGNLGVLKSFLTEITDDTNSGAGFSYMSVAWAVGTVLAPLAGGLLCNPVSKYPSIFRKDSLLGWTRNLFISLPYLLPVLVCVSFGVITTIFAALTLRETKRRGGSRRGSRRPSAEDSGDGQSQIQLSILSNKAKSSTSTLPTSSSTPTSASPTSSPSLSRYSIVSDEDDDESDEANATINSNDEECEGQIPKENKLSKEMINFNKKEAGVGGTEKGLGIVKELESGQIVNKKDNFDNYNYDDDDDDDEEEDDEEQCECCCISRSHEPLPSSSSHALMDNMDNSAHHTGTRGDSAMTTSSSSLSTSTPSSSSKRFSRVLTQRTVLTVCLNYGVLAMAYIILEETIPLFLKLSSDMGGFGFSSVKIGFLLSLSGSVMLVFTYFFLPIFASNSKAWMFKCKLINDVSYYYYHFYYIY